MFNWNDEDILYKPELMVIVEYIPTKNCYRAKPFFTSRKTENFIYLQQISGVAPFTETWTHNINPQDTIISEVTQDSPQVASIYDIQTTVIALVPRSISNTPTDQLVGFIIGKVSSPFFYKNNDNKTCIDNIQDIDTDQVFQKVNALNQTEPVLNVKDNFGKDLIPGDYVQRGLQSYTLLDNGSYSFGTDLTRTYHSSITGEIFNTSMLQQEYTIYSDKTTYVIATDIFEINKYASNTHMAGFDCIDSTGAVVKDPLYLYVEASSDLIEGRYYTQYQLDPTKENTTKLPVYQKKVGTDGSYTVKSVKGIHLEHTVTEAFDEIDCKGAHFKPYANSEDMTYTAGEEIPQTDMFSKQTPYSADPEKKVSAFDVGEDGSIILKDAWGSYIKLYRGNIQIHAANDLFITSNRDTLCFTGGTETHWAANGMHLDTSLEGDILMRAGKDCKVQASNWSVTSTNAYINSSGLSCIDGNTLMLGSNKDTTKIITIGNYDSQITTEAQRTNIVNSADVNLITPGSCLTLSGSHLCQIHADIELSGNIILLLQEKTITVNDTSYVYPAASGSVWVTTGGVYSNSLIASCVGMMAPYTIAETVASTSGQMGGVKEVPISKVRDMLLKLKKEKELTITIKSTTDQFDELLSTLPFKFTNIPGNCTYTLELSEDVGIPRNLITEGGYAYPGEGFWEANGLTTITVDDQGKSKEETKGFKNYLYN